MHLIQYRNKPPGSFICNNEFLGGGLKITKRLFRKGNLFGNNDFFIIIKKLAFLFTFLSSVKRSNFVQLLQSGAILK